MLRPADRPFSIEPDPSLSLSRVIAGAIAVTFTIIASLLSGSPSLAHDSTDDITRTAIVSAFAPEIEILKQQTENATAHRINGIEFVTGTLERQPVVLFLSGISVVNSAMTVQLALERFTVERIIFSGIAGGLDPSLNIGDVVIAERWGQYLETVIARETADGHALPGFFEYPFAGYGNAVPRSVTVARDGAEVPETRFWFPADSDLLVLAQSSMAGVTLRDCTGAGVCLENGPRILVGGAGVSGSAFVDNADFREYVFSTFKARLVDMESAAVAHVAWANHVPFIAVRSLSDLAGGSEQENQFPVFLELAADNSAEVVRALLRALPE